MCAPPVGYSNEYPGGYAERMVLAAALLGSFAMGVYMADLPVSPQRLKLYNWHKWAGVTILALSALRLAWRLLEGDITRQLDGSYDFRPVEGDDAADVYERVHVGTDAAFEFEHQVGCACHNASASPFFCEQANGLVSR